MEWMELVFVAVATYHQSCFISSSLLSINDLTRSLWFYQFCIFLLYMAIYAIYETISKVFDITNHWNSFLPNEARCVRERPCVSTCCSFWLLHVI